MVQFTEATPNTFVILTFLFDEQSTLDTLRLLQKAEQDNGEILVVLSFNYDLR